MGIRSIGGFTSPANPPLNSLSTTSGVCTQYQGMYTLQGQGQAQPNSQWVQDPLSQLDVLHLDTDNVPNGSLNNTFVDSSSVGRTVTRVNNTTQGTASPFSNADNMWSVAMSGTASTSITVTGGAGLAFGTSSWTIELYVNFYSTATLTYLYDARVATPVEYSPVIYRAADNSIRFFTNGADAIVSKAGVAPYRWYHIAVSFDSGTNTARLFIDGVLNGSATISGATWLNGASRPRLGSDGATTGTNILNGVLSNVRVNKGTALYTADFSPSSIPLTAITGTQLLTCQNYRIVDNSTAAQTITATVAAGITPTPTGPFPQILTPTYASPNIGSAYFDGTGDALTVADSPSLELGTSDFCVEMLFTSTSGGGTYTLLDKRLNAGVPPIMIWRNGANIQIYLSSSTTGDITSANIGSFLLGRWNHVAVYRIGTNFYGALNGVITVLKTGSSLAIANNTSNYTFGLQADLSGNPWLGYITNIRMVIGSSVYTATSAPMPTAPLTAIPNTQLLINGANAKVTDSALTTNFETVGTSARVDTLVTKYGSGAWYMEAAGGLIASGGNGTAYFSAPLFYTFDFTIEAWISTFNLTSARSVISKGTSTTGWTVTVTTAGFLQFTDGSTNFTSKTSIPIGAWTHIAIVRSGLATNNLRIYINGVFDTEGTTTSTFNQTDPMYIGASRTGTTPFYGWIYDVRLTKAARYKNNFVPPRSSLPQR